MINLCCLLNPFVECYYCDIRWCEPCWSNAGEYKTFPICDKGKYPDERHGHFTMPYNEELEPWIAAWAEKGRTKIMPAAATEETAKKI